MDGLIHWLEGHSNHPFGCHAQLAESILASDIPLRSSAAHAVFNEWSCRRDRSKSLGQAALL